MFFEVKKDYSPAKDFIMELETKIQKELLKILKLLETIEILKEPYFKKLKNSDGIWEARKRFGSDSYRVLFFFHKDNIVVLTNGFIKKQQKTPKEEINMAQKYKKEYLRRIK